MAINKIENAEYLDSDWQNEIITKNLMKKGLKNLDIDFDGTDLTIKSGSYLDFDGVIYEVDSDIVISGPQDKDSYIVFNYDTTPTITSTTDSLPAYSFSKQGYYDGNRRFLYYFPEEDVVEDLDRSNKIYYDMNSKGTFLIEEYTTIEEIFEQILSKSYSDTTLSSAPMAIDINNKFIFVGIKESLFKFSYLGDEIWEFTGHTDVVRGVAVDADGYVYTTSLDDTVRKIDYYGNEVWSYDNNLRQTYCAVIDTYGYVYFGDNSAAVKKLSPDGSLVWTKDVGTGNNIIAITEDKSGYIYAGDRSGSVYKIDYDGNQIWKITPHTEDVSGIEFDYIEQYIYTCSDDNTVKKIDLDGNEVWTFTGHSGTVYGIAVDSDGYVYSVSFDNLIKIDSDGDEVWTKDPPYGPRDIKIIKKTTKGSESLKTEIIISASTRLYKYIEKEIETAKFYKELP